jgi:hypothetical protein
MRKSSQNGLVFPRLKTPPPPPSCPSTPPPKSSSSSKLKLSAHHTPLSHRGLHMSPSPSLVHYKSNLDPPQPALDLDRPPPPPFEIAPGSEPLRTPSRKRPNAAAFAPVTPKRLFPSAGSHTPPGENGGDRFGIGGLFGTSSFRSPGVFDPSDPAALLDDEFARMGSTQLSGLQDSPGPGGLFGKAGKGLLYESPGTHSPDRLTRYW